MPPLGFPSLADDEQLDPLGPDFPRVVNLLQPRSPAVREAQDRKEDQRTFDHLRTVLPIEQDIAERTGRWRLAHQKAAELERVEAAQRRGERPPKLPNCQPELFRAIDRHMARTRSTGTLSRFARARSSRSRSQRRGDSNSRSGLDPPDGEPPGEPPQCRPRDGAGQGSQLAPHFSPCDGLPLRRGS